MGGNNPSAGVVYLGGQNAQGTGRQGCVLPVGVPIAGVDRDGFITWLQIRTPCPAVLWRLIPGVTMCVAGGESIPLHASGRRGRHRRGSGRCAVRRHGEPACARSRGAAALLLWVGSREHATLPPKRINHRSDLPLILTISLADTCKRRLYSAPKESTPLPGEGCLLLLSRWGRNFAAAARC